MADDELSEDYVIPSVFNREVAPAVAAAVSAQARASGTGIGDDVPCKTRQSPRPARARGQISMWNMLMRAGRG